MRQKKRNKNKEVDKEGNKEEEEQIIQIDREAHGVENKSEWAHQESRCKRN
jgi:hypothetical protein